MNGIYVDNNISCGNEEQQRDGQEKSRGVEEFRFERGTSVVFGATPFIDGHQLERDEDKEKEKRAVVLTLQQKLDA